MRKFFIYGPPFLAAIAGMLIGLYVGSSIGDPPIAKQPDLQSMNQCVGDTLSLQG